ncbi:MAG: alkaline phosphatase family protein [Gloeobacteraceae cyanobacterium ES-bin-144]|nr:alkaline phosphatase family protein [Verrucomicrobiales bacterium]
MQPILRTLACFAMFTSLHAERMAEHVFIISLDGAKPSVVKESEMPALKRLAAEGAVTWTARTIFPPKTLPSHTSMLTGVGPDKHQVLWNSFEPERGKIKTPAIFAIAKTDDATVSTAMFPGKAKFRHLWQTGSLDRFDFGGLQVDTPVSNGSEEIEKTIVPAQTVAKIAAAYIMEKKPNLCFIHFPDPDSAGHKSGWGSPEQKEALKVSDQALSQIIKAIATANITGSSVLIITSDHGGHDKTHGLDIPDDMEIPWIAWGKGVKKNHSIAGPVTTYDSAATALWLLGIPLPENFDGKPVKEAFAQ